MNACRITRQTPLSTQKPALKNCKSLCQRKDLPSRKVLLINDLPIALVIWFVLHWNLLFAILLTIPIGKPIGGRSFLTPTNQTLLEAKRIAANEQHGIVDALTVARVVALYGLKEGKRLGAHGLRSDLHLYEAGARA